MIACRAVVSHRIPEGSAFMYHSQDRHVNVPISETSGHRGGTDNSVTRIIIKPTHLIGGYAQLSWGFNYYGAIGSQRDALTLIRKRQTRGHVLMRVMAQVGMVMNLDKCIGCHTCSVTCKNVWTNRKGAEYMWFNDVETKPGIGYPKRWEDQEHWKGGWELDRKGKLRLKAGGPLRKLASIFANPDLPDLDDYYEPWTYDYSSLISAGPSKHQPVARPVSRVTGDNLDLKWGPNWEDDLGGGPDHVKLDPNLRDGVEEQVKAEFESVFMMYLPRICEHCLNPACVASCPSGAMYKREEDGIVLVDQEKCRGWRMCVSGCPYKKVYFNWQTGKAEKCTLCYPRIEAGMPTVCSETCVGRIRYLGIVLYDADRVEAAASVTDEHDLLDAQLDVFLDPARPRRSASRPAATASPRTGWRPRSARRSGSSRWTGGSRCRCIPSTARSRWSGTSRRSRR